jgi:hypothetical protein
MQNSSSSAHVFCLQLELVQTNYSKYGRYCMPEAQPVTVAFSGSGLPHRDLQLRSIKENMAILSGYMKSSKIAEVCDVSHCTTVN